MTSLLVYGPSAWNSTQVRAWCPTHHVLHYAKVTCYYDYWRIDFTCGASVEPSNSTWIADRKGYVSSKRHLNTGRRRRITKAMWEHWKPFILTWIRRIPAERERIRHDHTRTEIHTDTLASKGAS